MEEGLSCRPCSCSTHSHVDHPETVPGARRAVCPAQDSPTTLLTSLNDKAILRARTGTRTKRICSATLVPHLLDTLDTLYILSSSPQNSPSGGIIIRTPVLQMKKHRALSNCHIVWLRGGSSSGIRLKQPGSRDRMRRPGHWHLVTN